MTLGKKLGEYLKAGDILALEGSLAAGKTTITKGIASSLGVLEDVTSPTFTIISEYEGRLPLYHFDVYRLSGGEDFINLGAEDLLYGTGVSIIEWSEKIREELPKRTITLNIVIQKDGSRTITLKNWSHEDFDI